MANLTLAIDDDVLKRARMRALEQDTTVNALVRVYLEGFAREIEPEDALAGLFALADRTRSGSGPGGRNWTRDSLYERE
jgi:hypothetical protein